MNIEKRVIELFEMIAHGNIQIALDPSNEGAGISLAKAQMIIEPRLTDLEAEVGGVHRQHGIDDSRINALRNAESVSAYVVGILSGLDLAQRPDIVGKFARMYAQNAPRSIDLLFTHNGGQNGQRVN